MNTIKVSFCKNFLSFLKKDLTESVTGDFFFFVIKQSISKKNDHEKMLCHENGDK